jgi:hypothetical protein
MTAALKLYLKFIVLFAVIFCAAYALRHLVVPDIVAIADNDLPQSTWKVEVAFVLTTLENLGMGGAALTLLLATGTALWRRLRLPATP